VYGGGDRLGNDEDWAAGRRFVKCLAVAQISGFEMVNNQGRTEAISL
jgi:hypothetical protein